MRSFCFFFLLGAQVPAAAAAARQRTVPPLSCPPPPPSFPIVAAYFILVHLLPPPPPSPSTQLDPSPLTKPSCSYSLVLSPPTSTSNHTPFFLSPFPVPSSSLPTPSPASRRPSHLPGLVDARGCHRSSHLCPTLASGLPTLIIKGIYLPALRPSSGPPGALLI